MVILKPIIETVTIFNLYDTTKGYYSYNDILKTVESMFDDDHVLNLTFKLNVNY